MITGAKFAVAGSVSGAMMAFTPVAVGIWINSKKKIEDEDFIKVTGGRLCTRAGEYVTLRCMNINDDYFYLRENGDVAEFKPKGAFNALSERFGDYGARELFGKCFENYITKSDIKFLNSSGINSIKLTLRPYLLFRNGKISKEEPDFKRLDKLVKTCRKAGTYIILALDADDFKTEKADIASPGRAGLLCRNNLIKVWTAVSEHFRNEPAIAAYDILNTDGADLFADETAVENTVSCFKRTAMALRSAEDEHALITDVPYALVNTFDIGDGNFIAGVKYSELSGLENEDGLIITGRKMVNETETVLRPDIRNKSAVFCDFKGKGYGSFLFAGKPSFDIVKDSYEDMTAKTASLLTNKNYALKEEENRILKNDSGAVPKKKPRKRVKIYYTKGQNLKVGK